MLNELKVFLIDDGEDWFILAKDEEQARNYYENSDEILDNEIKKELIKDNGGDIRKAYEFREITEINENELEISEDKPLLAMLHEYKNEAQWDNDVKVLDYAKYIVLRAEVRKEKLELPMIIGGSCCS